MASIWRREPSGRIGQFDLIKHRSGEQAYVLAASFWEAPTSQTYDVSTTEAASAGDSPDATVTAGSTTHNVSIAESGTASDSPSAIETRVAGVTEAAAASDAPTAVYTTAASVAEAATAADLPNGGAPIAVDVIEWAFASDDLGGVVPLRQIDDSLGGDAVMAISRQAGATRGMVATRMEAERINLRAALRDYGLRRP